MGTSFSAGFLKQIYTDGTHRELLEANFASHWVIR